MRKYLKKNFYKALFIIVVFVFIIIISFHDKIEQLSLDTFLQNIVYTIQKPLDDTFQTASNSWNKYINLSQLQEENKRLKEENNRLKTLYNSSQEFVTSYKRLEKLLKFKENEQGIHTASQIIGLIPNKYSDFLLIDKGSIHGIKKNNGVIIPEGVVGRVYKVYESSAIIQLITDIRLNLPILIQPVRQRAILESTQQQEIFVRYIPVDTPIKKGDRVVTSGLTGIFPKGLLIGTIGAVYKNEFNPSLEAKINPSVDFLKLEEVFIFKSLNFDKIRIFKEENG